ncbi:uncharacterized protein Z518_00942 [Rhinocladiella mackenziei CBS 650.93]|uniref:Spindle pole body-associated protein cut12 domain-containing protein n=1 Tax=Rhinocladiella mackenziei CBS 650.93 TaxID=1442369 RepID=A0A0D2J2D3_9EURO|nr:uncharacterized protein Z518_00942 [Rhinocladiella mackenziei CBS 650.93]KIX09861.1 hypothetical protein Z518_00942 [Rhinocladiella mackenziei CBS 650.93]
MSGHETILEDPITPAPLFAYRAIRSMFFASPDSSPEHENKENIAPPSPMRSKFLVDGPVQLTPSQKRKWDSQGTVLSPTKGILRTPGLPTPRAKYLRDINVKFKSLSPEAVDKTAEAPKPEYATLSQGSSVSTEASPAIRASKPMKELTFSKKTHSSQPKSDKQPIISAPKEPPSTSAPTIVTATTDVLCPSQIHAYVQQTEREVKRLVRYGQKMREYARKKDAENQELKYTIEQLRKENERLRNENRSVGRANLEAKHGARERDRNLAAVGVSRGDVGEEVVRHQAQAGNAVPNTWSCRTTGPDTDVDTRQKPSSSTLRSSTQPGSASSSVEPQVRSDLAPPTQAIRPANSVGLGVGTSTSTGTAITRLPPDREAAARERLRRRMEVRKASTENDKLNQKTQTIVDTGQGSQTLNHEVQNQSQDVSQVDWVNL